MKFQLVSRQTSESIGASPDAVNTQLVFTGVVEDPIAPTPGMFSSSISLAVTQAEGASYVIGGHYDMSLTEAQADLE